MPYKNAIKLDRADTYYHVYSRGQNKSLTFLNSSHYNKFLDILSRYLDPSEKKYDKLNDQISVHALCLMPNHFHLLVKVKFPGGMGRLMRRVLTTYSIYFNTAMNRQGKVFQGAYRAIPIQEEEQLINTAIYIHLNPVIAGMVKKAQYYNYSSCKSYQQSINPFGWLAKDPVILDNTDWENIESYKDGVSEESPW